MLICAIYKCNNYVHMIKKNGAIFCANLMLTKNKKALKKIP